MIINYAVFLQNKNYLQIVHRFNTIQNVIGDTNKFTRQIYVFECLRLHRLRNYTSTCETQYFKRLGSRTGFSVRPIVFFKEKYIK